MKKLAVFVFIIMLFVLGCNEAEEAYIAHVYGWARRATIDSLGINGLKLRVRDINPEDLEQIRDRFFITISHDQDSGFFYIDSVCYGTNKVQGTGYFSIFVDSVENPEWPNQYWSPDIQGPVDTVEIYLEK